MCNEEGYEYRSIQYVDAYIHQMREKTMLKAILNRVEETQESLFEKKYYHVTADLKHYRVNQLKKMGHPNSTLVTEFLFSKMREGNLKPASRSSTIDRLCQLSSYHNNKKFREMTNEDVFTYLDSIRRTESEDPLHRWIGTYNLSLIKITSFFKWLHEPDVNSQVEEHPSF
jgi:hypothetical protein